MSTTNSAYMQLMQNVLAQPHLKKSRTGIATKSVFGLNASYDLRWNRLPMLTNKKMSVNAVRYELDWYLSGETNLKPLIDRGIHYWDAWATDLEYDESGAVADGRLPDIYQSQWRHWQDTRLVPASGKQQYLDRGYKHIADTTNDLCVMHREIDQIADLVHNLINDPYSRRHVLTAWNPSVLDTVALPPCHLMAIWSVQDIHTASLPQSDMINYYLMENYDVAAGTVEAARMTVGLHQTGMLNDVMNKFITNTPTIQELNCNLIMRSNDIALGHPYNAAHYGLLTHLLAYKAGMQTGRLQVVMTDAHIYENQIDGACQHINQDAILASLDTQYPETLVDFSDIAGTTDDVDLRWILERTKIHYKPQAGGIQYPEAAV